MQLQPRPHHCFKSMTVGRKECGMSLCFHFISTSKDWALNICLCSCNLPPSPSLFHPALHPRLRQEEHQSETSAAPVLIWDKWDLCSTKGIDPQRHISHPPHTSLLIPSAPFFACLKRTSVRFSSRGKCSSHPCY